MTFFLQQVKSVVLARSRKVALLVALGISGTGLTAQTQTGAQPSVIFLQGRTALQETDYSAAIRQMERAVELEDANADYHYWLGRALYESAPRASKIRMPGIARRVRKEWERAVALDPGHVEARAGLAEYYAMAPGF